MATDGIRIADLELQITSNSTTAVQGLDVLIAKLEELKKTTAGSLGLTRIAKQFSNFNSAIQALDISKLEKIRDTLTALRDLKRLNLVRVETPTGESTTQSKEIDKTATTAASSIEQTATDTERLDEAAKNASKSLKETNKQLKETEKPAQKAGNALTKFIKSLGRIAFYRAIRSAIKGVTQSFKTGIQNLYQFDKEVGGSFSKSLDSIASSISTIKNSLGLIVAPIVESLAPAFERASETIMEFGNTVSRISAQINGKTTYTKAVRSIKEYQESIEKAKDATQGFDELNIADSGKEDISSMYEQVELAEDLTDTDRALADVFTLIKNIGTVLREKILPAVKDLFNEILPSLPPLLKTINTILYEIVDTIGNVLQSDEFKQLVVELGNSIESVLKMVMDFLPAIRKVLEIIYKVLVKIIGAISQIIKNGIGKAESSTRVILTVVNGIVDLVDKILELLSPILDIVVRLIDIITTLVDSVLVGIHPLLKVIFKVVGSIVDLVVNLIEMGLEPIAPILDLIIGLLNNDLMPAIKTINDIVSPFLQFVGDVIQFIVGWIEIIAKALTGSLGAAIETVKQLFKGLVALFTSGSLKELQSAWDECGANIRKSWEKVGESLKGVFEKVINKMRAGFETFLNACIDGLNAIGRGLKKVGDFFGFDTSGIKVIDYVSFPPKSYASGGYGIPNGQLFIANEAGAELVGSMNNRTTVANNQQIVEGIKQGVIDAMLSVADFSNSGDKNINLAVYLDGRQIKAEIDRLSQSKGATIATGGLAYYG